MPRVSSVFTPGTSLSFVLCRLSFLLIELVQRYLQRPRKPHHYLQRRRCFSGLDPLQIAFGDHGPRRQLSQAQPFLIANLTHKVLQRRPPLLPSRRPQPSLHKILSRKVYLFGGTPFNLFRHKMPKKAIFRRSDGCRGVVWQKSVSDSRPPPQKKQKTENLSRSFAEIAFFCSSYLSKGLAFLT